MVLFSGRGSGEEGRGEPPCLLPAAQTRIGKTVPPAVSRCVSRKPWGIICICQKTLSLQLFHPQFLQALPLAVGAWGSPGPGGIRGAWGPGRAAAGLRQAPAHTGCPARCHRPNAPRKKKIIIIFSPENSVSPPLGVNSGEGRGGGAGPAGPREAWSPPGPCSLAAGRGASGALGGQGGRGKPPVSSSGAALRGGALRARGGGGLAGPRSDGGCGSKRG